MINKICTRTDGDGFTEYVMGALSWTGELRHEQPIILFGDADLFGRVARVSPFAQAIHSECFSWGEPFAEVGFEKMKEVVWDAYRLRTGDLPPTEFSALAVLHVRERGFDAHLGICRSHLASHRSVPFGTTSDADKHLWQDWRRNWNLREGWSDPADPWRRRLNDESPNFLTRSARELWREIDGAVCDAIRAGVILESDEIPRYLADIGCETNSDELGVIVQDGKSKLKMRTGKYRPGREFSEADRLEPETRSRGRTDVERELARIGPRLDCLRSRRAEMFGRRFGRRADPLDHAIRQHAGALDRDRDGGGADEAGGTVGEVPARDGAQCGPGVVDRPAVDAGSLARGLVGAALCGGECIPGVDPVLAVGQAAAGNDFRTAQRGQRVVAPQSCDGESQGERDGGGTREVANPNKDSRENSSEGDGERTNASVDPNTKQRGVPEGGSGENGILDGGDQKGETVNENDDDRLTRNLERVLGILQRARAALCSAQSQWGANPETEHSDLGATDDVDGTIDRSRSTNCEARGEDCDLGESEHRNARGDRRDAQPADAAGESLDIAIRYFEQALVEYEERFLFRHALECVNEDSMDHPVDEGRRTPGPVEHKPPTPKIDEWEL